MMWKGGGVVENLIESLRTVVIAESFGFVLFACR